jgi:uncharacterized protein YjiS (DUF1127 family)
MGNAAIEAEALPAASQGSARPWQAALMKAIKRWIARISNERRIRRGINELMALDEHQLSDIGLTRGNIEHAARYGRFSTGLEERVIQP